MYSLAVMLSVTTSNASKNIDKISRNLPLRTHLPLLHLQSPLQDKWPFWPLPHFSQLSTITPSPQFTLSFSFNIEKKNLLGSGLSQEIYNV
jgi:hypothetical protein